MGRHRRQPHWQSRYSGLGALLGLTSALFPDAHHHLVHLQRESLASAGEHAARCPIWIADG